MNKANKEKILTPRINEIMDLENGDFEVVDINNGKRQFRINGRLDLYPLSQKYFNLKTQK